MTEPLEVREARASRIKQFLEDEVVAGAVAAMKERNYALFLGAKDDAGRQMAQAQGLVMDALLLALQGVVDDGDFARNEREQRDRAPVAR